LDQRAHERMIIKKPTARTKESRMTAGRGIHFRGVVQRRKSGAHVLLRPAAMSLYLDKGDQFICIAEVALCERSDGLD
jgi:hypothetical protein